MTIHEATEQAYKKGYEDGQRDAVKGFEQMVDRILQEVQKTHDMIVKMVGGKKNG